MNDCIDWLVLKEIRATLLLWHTAKIIGKIQQGVQMNYYYQAWANLSFSKLDLVIDFQKKARALKLESVSFTNKGQQDYNDDNY